jgi:hypothetical protein
MLRVGTAIAIASSLVLAAFVSLSLIARRDPFDKFEVIGIEGEHGSARFAVTYRYHHADSSNDLFATWILSEPPLLGSTDPPPGRAAPVLAWTSNGDVVSRNWVEGRLVAAASRDSERRPGKFNDCYFEYDSVHLVCFDPRAVEVVDGTR